jgi:hypothetical protein
MKVLGKRSDKEGFNAFYQSGCLCDCTDCMCGTDCMNGANLQAIGQQAQTNNKNSWKSYTTSASIAAQMPW